MCGCPKAAKYFAAMWTNAGLKAHVHDDGSTGSDGPDGVGLDRDATKKAGTLLAVGWLKRGWV